ncbi:hypothetical protein [Candidatus Accumulibacter phosphatis]|uniref:hypothetical protein n=1 Tax=Candidatus Accumulibacter phosphatis TaxID=327160 RepID=UPI0020C07424|nr:hypothetical protein [Candidatus Accumulibacter phosphatis]
MVEEAFVGEATNGRRGDTGVGTKSGQAVLVAAAKLRPLGQQEADAALLERLFDGHEVGKFGVEAGQQGVDAIPAQHFVESFEQGRRAACRVGQQMPAVAAFAQVEPGIERRVGEADDASAKAGRVAQAAGDRTARAGTVGAGVDAGDGHIPAQPVLLLGGVAHDR